MIVLNFSGHPLTDEQKRQMSQITSERSINERMVSCFMEFNEQFASQVAQKLSAVNLTKDEINYENIAVILPQIAQAAVLVVLGVQGIIGRLPQVVRMVKSGRDVPRFEVAEVISLEVFSREARNRELQKRDERLNR